MTDTPFSPSPFSDDPQPSADHPVHAHNPPLSEEEAGSPLEEAKAAAMSIEVRALDGAEYEGAPEAGVAPPSATYADQPVAAAAHRHLGGDMVVPPSTRFRKGEWEHEFSGHKIAVEITRIENEVRKIFDERDPKRKRKLNGLRRWQELEEDVISLKFTGRMDESALRELTRLAAQHKFLTDQLRFVASTRATWNT